MSFNYWVRYVVRLVKSINFWQECLWIRARCKIIIQFKRWLFIFDVFTRLRFFLFLIFSVPVWTLLLLILSHSFFLVQKQNSLAFFLYLSGALPFVIRWYILSRIHLLFVLCIAKYGSSWLVNYYLLYIFALGGSISDISSRYLNTCLTLSICVWILIYDSHRLGSAPQLFLKIILFWLI